MEDECICITILTKHAWPLLELLELVSETKIDPTSKMHFSVFYVILN